jgi:hypothetical protein
MVARDRGGGVIAAIATASLLIGCASGSGTSMGTTTPMPTSRATANVTPGTTSNPAPTAAIYGPVSVVTGVETCTVDFGTITTEADFVEHGRNGTAECTDTVNDVRVSGTYTATWNIDYWGTRDHGNGALVQWGTGRLVAGEGVWLGRATGVYSSDRGDTIAWWWTGSGAYAGLTYFMLATGGGPWTIQGQIFPGSPPQP